MTTNNTFDLGSVVTVNNKMQKGYTFELVAERGAPTHNFDPVFTPGEMLRLGIFGGVYMRDALHEYPDEMTQGAKFHQNGPCQYASINAFGVKSGDNLEFWRAKGWIHEDDPRGWFEWYCRYWLGRRHEDDYRQMARWRMFAPRHAGMVKAFGVRDLSKRRATRQGLLHWSHDPMPDITCLAGETVSEKTFRLLEIKCNPENTQ